MTINSCIQRVFYHAIFSVISVVVALFFSETLFGQQERTIPIDKGTIHYKTFGSGVPILIINGGPGMNSNGFVPIAEALCDGNTTIIYDQRGTGKSKLSNVNENTITLDLMVEDIETIREDIKTDTWIVLGHSFGGMLASYYTSKYPERVSALILSSSGGTDLGLLGNVNVNSRLTKMQQDSLQYWNQQIAQGETSYYARLQRGMNLAPAYLYDKSYTHTVAKRLTEGNSTINGLVWQNMRAMDFNCTNGLTDYENPVLILQGKNDILDVSIAEKTHSVFKNSKLVLLDECGHYGWLDSPEIYFKEINSFLKRIQKS